MPIYEYRCDECRKRSSALLGSYMSADPPCPHCGKKALQRLVSNFATVRSDDADAGGNDFGDGDDFDGAGGGGDFDGGGGGDFGGDDFGGDDF
ncbi:MAG: zinc ribbon domain-containing protein [Candidatus Dormiibacterota bacterium]